MGGAAASQAKTAVWKSTTFARCDGSGSKTLARPIAERFRSHRWLIARCVRKAEMCSSAICCDVPKSAYSSGGLLWVGSQIDDSPCLACRALYLARFSDRDLHT
jgi:hypothetical protein